MSTNEEISANRADQAPVEDFHVEQVPSESAPVPNAPDHRGPGRPPKDDPVVTPEVLQKIAEMHVTGKRIREIGRAIGVSHETVRYHLDHTVRPWLAANVCRKRDDILGELSEMRRLLWNEIQEELADAGGDDIVVRETVFEDFRGEKPTRRTVVQRVSQRRRRPNPARMLGTLAKCIDLEAKLIGISKPKEPVEQRRELRWAGIDPEIIQNDMVRLLATRIKELHDKKDALDKMD